MRAKGRGSVGRPLPDDCTYSIYPDLPAPLCVQSEVLVTSNILATSQNGSFRYRPVYPGISGLFTQDCLGTLFLSMLPLPARVTARIIAFLVGDPYKSLFLVILFSSFLGFSFKSNPQLRLDLKSLPLVSYCRWMCFFAGAEKNMYQKHLNHVGSTIF